MTPDGFDIPAPSQPGLGANDDLDTNETSAAQELGQGEATRAIDPEEHHEREVFADYIATREKCGEPIGALTLDKFRAKLAANREQIIAKYACRSARFSVYVKDGKAALKATPVK